MLGENVEKAEDSQEVKLERDPFAMDVTVACGFVEVGVHAEVAVGYDIISNSVDLAKVFLVVEWEIRLWKSKTLYQETSEHLLRHHETKFIQHRLQVWQIQLTVVGMEKTRPIAELTEADT